MDGIDESGRTECDCSGCGLTSHINRLHNLSQSDLEIISKEGEIKLVNSQMPSTETHSK
jgi:pyruvate/2-oxoacid:ferredoxin oxidoreductase beta subunit